MNADIGLYLPLLAKLPVKGNMSIYVNFLIAVFASAVPCVFIMKSVFGAPEKRQQSKTWSALFFVAGMMLIVAGMFVYWILGAYGKPAAIVHGIGVGMILAMLLVGTYESSGVFSGQAIFFNSFTLVVVLAALALLVGVNYLGRQKDKKFDFNKKKLQSLDSATVNKLKSLKEPVEVLIFVTKQERNQVPRIKEFFDKYASINRDKFKVRFINPLNEPELAGCYGVREGKKGKMPAQVLIAAGQCVRKGGKNASLSFKGKKLSISQLKEEHVTNRMIRVTRKSDKKVCFLTGRSQPKTSGQKTSTGFHFLKQVLEDKGFKTMDLNLIDKDEVPKDCRMLVNAAPEFQSVRPAERQHVARLSDQEVDKIERYLDKGGKMMLFLEPSIDTGLGKLLQTKFGIGWDPGLTLEFRKNVGRPEIFFSTTFNNKHTITKGFKQANARLYFWNATALKKTGTVAGVSVKNIVQTDQIKVGGMTMDRKTGKVKRVTLKCCSFYIPTPHGMRFRYLQREYVKIRPVLMARRAATGFVERIMPKAQRKAVSLVMSASKKTGKAGQETRIVVVADSFLGSNRGLRFRGYGNVTLMINSFAWLAHEKDLVALPPKNRKVKKLALTAVTRNTIQYTTRFAMPVFFLFVILLVMAIRKQK
jgi:hypothetical protein